MFSLMWNWRVPPLPGAVAGGVVEAAICYTGDVFTGEQGKRGADYKYKCVAQQSTPSCAISGPGVLNPSLPTRPLSPAGP